MAVIDMKKVTLVGMERDKETILKSIQAMGILEIVNIEDQSEDGDHGKDLELEGHEGLKDLESIQSQLSAVEFALELLNKYQPVKKGMFDMKPEVDKKTLLQALDTRHETLKLVDQCRKLDEELSQLSLRENRLNNTIVQIEPWRQLDIPLDKIEDTPTTRVVAGTVNKGAAQRFIEAVNQIESQLLLVKELGETKEDVCYFIVYHKSIEDDVQGVFKEFAFSASSFAGFEGTPQEIISQTKKQLDQIQETRGEIVKKITEYSNIRPDLELLYDALLIELDRHNAAQHLINTNHTFVLTGWIPAKETENFDKNLRNQVKDIYIKLEDPADDEDFPVVLDNPDIVTPFEMVTNLYSTPNPRELDPNTVMAPFMPFSLDL